MILLILVLKYLILLLICLFVLNVILNFSPGGKTKKAVLVAISSGTAAVQRGEKWGLGKGVLLGRGSDARSSFLILCFQQMPVLFSRTKSTM